MQTRRLATTGVALVAALGLGLTGCGTKTGADAPAANGSASAAASAPADALGELTAAAQKLNQQSVRIKIDSAVLSGGGVLDPAKKSGDMTLTMGAQGKFRILMAGDDAYLKVTGLTGLPDKWMHMDATKLGASGQLNLMPDGDPGGAQKMIKSVVDVRKTGEGAFAGTMDYTRTLSSDKDIQALGDKAKAVPFTAKTDAEGRLVEFAIDTSVIQAALGTMTSTYSDFGTAVKVTPPPAGETQEAPAELVKAFGA
ncbi:hypothetical protein ACFOW4_27515 [Micromonospora sp. GCM10011542]|uniref:hypothetical protein n=1 Tax=Micromonospora sp. GCM10011542 TaxID=3317337 RepID=UPI003607E753